MKRRQSARQRRASERLSGSLIRRVCSSIFPHRNDYSNSIADFDELVPELEKFGITSRGDLQRMLTCHRRTLMQIHRAPFDEMEREIYADWIGENTLLMHIRRQFFYAYPGFVRNALELQFGDAASGHIADSI